MKKIAIRVIGSLLTVIIIVLSFPEISLADVDYEACDNIMVSIDGGDYKMCKALYYDYDNATYISLRDLANALNGSSKAFELSVDGSTARITTGMDYKAIGFENGGFSEDEIAKGYENKAYLKHNLLYRDDRELFYYTFIVKSDGYNDCFMNVLDVMMAFNLNMEWNDNGISINTDKNFYVDIDELLSAGYFRLVNSALVGNASTGEIYFEKNKDMQVAMASTTKLMTYLVLAEGLKNGEISYDDSVEISPNSARISHTGDGVIWFEEGNVFSFDDLMKAMLLASSNESALALAEHLCGSEGAFVARMNQKAAEIGLSEQTVFYNTNGLPSYDKKIYQLKRQNYITAEDMFKLCTYIINEYPEILEITSLKSAKLSTIGTEVSTTNILLYNMDGITGLKTGTTNKAGCCLVTSGINDKGENIIAIEFGAESSTLRGQISQLLMSYGLSCNTPLTESADVKVPNDCASLLKLIDRMH